MLFWNTNCNVNPLLAGVNALRVLLMLRLGNPNLVHAILKSRKRFESLREFTLEAGQQELERIAQQRKDQQESAPARSVRTHSMDASHHQTGHRSANLQEVPEDSAFTIGDDDDDDDADPQTPQTPQSPSSPLPRASAHSSRAASVASSADDTVPFQLRGMSEKARGKMPVGTPLLSRQNSVSSLHSLTPTATNNGLFQPTPDWVCLSCPIWLMTSNHWQIESWQPELPLHTILTILSELPAQLPLESEDTTAILAAIPNVQPLAIEPTPVRVHLFEWSSLSLGWYESLLWGFIFTSEMLVSRGTAGVWNKTNIKLFRVQETAAQAPSLASPRGAVDAVGSSIVNRIGSLNLRGATSATSISNGIPGDNAGQQIRVRDV